MRVTRKDLESMTRRLNERENRPEAAYCRDGNGGTHNCEGHIILDYAECYGGYALRVVSGKGEGFLWPRWYRVSGREMFAYLSGRLGE